MGDRVAVMQRGGILAQYDTARRDPRRTRPTEFVARFVGSRPRPQAAVADARRRRRARARGDRHASARTRPRPAGASRDPRAPLRSCCSTRRTVRSAGSTTRDLAGERPLDADRVDAERRAWSDRESTLRDALSMMLGRRMSDGRRRRRARAAAWACSPSTQIGDGAPAMSAERPVRAMHDQASRSSCGTGSSTTWTIIGARPVEHLVLDRDRRAYRLRASRSCWPVHPLAGARLPRHHRRSRASCTRSRASRCSRC